jgi:hypothetical protein
MMPVILAIQLQQVERIQKHRVVMATGMKPVEIRLAVRSSPDRFPVHYDGLYPERQEVFDYPRILVRPVVASAGVEPDSIAVVSGNQPVAVMLNLMDPYRPAGSLLGRAGQGAMKPRGREIFAPGTRMAVDRGRQMGGQGKWTPVPVVGLGESLRLRGRLLGLPAPLRLSRDGGP